MLSVTEFLLWFPVLFVNRFVDLASLIAMFYLYSQVLLVICVYGFCLVCCSMSSFSLLGIGHKQISLDGFVILRILLIFELVV